jgi:exonuclease SbcD
MIKVLISADWHIGKKLHQIDLKEDMNLFFQWLLNYIVGEKITHLLVAGDVFDHSNPSQEAQEVYYSFLKQLHATGCHTIITAGNHDSPGFLDAGKKLVTLANVNVVGQYPGIEFIDEIFFELKDYSDKVQAVVAAIPFITDRFIRTVGEGEGATELAEKLKLGVKKIFEEVGLKLREKYPSLPKIGMGHLHAQGSNINEEERDIMIGGEGGVPVDYLNQFDFLGLGHIHIGNSVTPTIRYASSPISLGFSEANYRHKVIELHISDGKIEQKDVEIPRFRKLKSIQGNFEEVKSKLEEITENPCPSLPILVDIKITEPNVNLSVRTQLQDLRESFQNHAFIELVNIRLIEESIDLRENLNEVVGNRRISDINLEEIFDALMADQLGEQEVPEDLRNLFLAISTDALQQK